jgi:hypothetical protein
MNRRVSHFVFLPPASNSLTGSLPTELGALSELKYLHMCKCNEQVEVMNRRVSYFVLLPPAYNSLTGSLPTELLAFSDLRVLFLGTSHESTSCSEKSMNESQSFTFCVSSTR